MLGRPFACLRQGAGALLLLIAAGCGSGPAEPQFDPRAYVGEWRLQVDAAPGCWPAMVMDFTVTAEDGARRSDMLKVASTWKFSGGSAILNPLAGYVERGSFYLTFTKRPGRSGHFNGKGPTPERMVGPFVDPWGVFRSGDGRNCTAAAVAERLP